MKNLFLAALISAVAVPSFAARVTSAKLDGKGNVLVDVVHGGGCGDHEYSLQLQGCLESFPVQCTAKLIHKTQDRCEAILRRTATISLAESGITGDYYAGGSLTISGDQRSSASVRLPKVLPQAQDKTSRGRPSSGKGKPSSASEKTVCVTHTGSHLEVDPDSQVINLTTTSGEEDSMSIVDTQEMVLESFPPIYQTTYKLEDGRSVVIEFRSGQKVGSGNFIRLNGEYSPDFQSCVKSK